MTGAEIEATVRSILFHELFGVLATAGPEGPHSTIVSFVAADDLHSIIFATPHQTRKFENIREKAKVSFFVDDRKNDIDRLFDIHGVEARGGAGELSGSDRDRYQGLFLARHPRLESFAAGAALVRIQVERYDIVQGFQNVFVHRPGRRDP